MFEDSLLEYRFDRSCRGKATLMSFVLQVALVGVLILLPRIFIEALPTHQLVTFLVAPAPPPPPQKRCRSER